MPRYSVTHTTRYTHNSPASAAWQALHLQPRNEPMQRCESFELQVAPHPTDLTSRFDYFGNKQHIFTLKEPHTVLDVTSRSFVVREEQVLPMAGLTPSLDQISDLVDIAVAEEDFTLEQFLHGSPLVPLLAEARALSDELGQGLGPGTSVMEWIAVAGERFCDRFTRKTIRKLVAGHMPLMQSAKRSLRTLNASAVANPNRSIHGRSNRDNHSRHSFAPTHRLTVLSLLVSAIRLSWCANTTSA